jgi:hypothetical protein
VRRKMEVSRSASGSSSGRAGRLVCFWGPGRASLISVVVGDEGDYFVGFEEFAAFEEAKLYEEGDAGYNAACV